MAELCDLLFQANWPEAKQQPSMFGSCLRVNLAMTGSCAADQKLNSVHLMCNCALFNAYQCDETAADGLSTPLGSLQSTLPDSQGSQPGDGLEDVGCIGQGIQKVKVIFASIQNMSFDFTRNYCFITK